MKKIFIPLITAIGKKIEKRRFSCPPVYIGGCGRSGTTLLLSILSAHKDIFACPRELNPFENAYHADHTVTAPKYYRIYRTLILQKIKPTANRYCEKSPANVRYIRLMDDFHRGNFRFIHIVRDGRDVILSRHPRGKQDYWVSPERWIRDVSAGLEFENHPSVFTIRYEDLVTRYTETIENICHFLDIPVSREILDWHKYTTIRKNNALHTSIESLNNTSIGKWARPENSKRVAELTGDERAAALLQRLQYTT